MNKILPLETPCYSIDYDELEYNFNGLKSAFSHYWKGPLCIGYSVKTNHLKWILEYMKENGVYAEVVSSDEYHLAELVGFASTKIIYNGPYKKQETLEYAIRNGSIVNIDSISELKQIALMDNIENIKVGLRVNFDLESECPGESALGKEPSRFGFCLENGEFENALNICRDMNISVCGLHMHQTTKTRSTKSFKILARKAAYCIKKYNLIDCLDYIDIGGGFFGCRGVVNRPTFDEYAKTISDELKVAICMEKTMLILEPGAALISSPISYYTKVISVKDVRGFRLVTVDGSILHMNPFYIKRVPPYKIYSNGEVYKNGQIICGSTCLENDRLFSIKNSLELQVGDIIEIEKCGAYTMCLNSCFINLPPVVYLYKNQNYVKIRGEWSFDKIL